MKLKLAIIVAAVEIFTAVALFDLWADNRGIPLFDPSAIAQLAHPERPWWDISWLWSHERSRFKVSRVDIRTAVKG